jgi:hypothetical protein
VLLDVDVNQKVFGKKHLQVTAERLVFGNDVVDLTRVSGCAWSPLTAILVTPDGEMKVALGESGKKKTAKPEQTDAFERLTAILDDVVVPRLAADAIARIRGGGVLEADKLTVGRDGIAIAGMAGRREYPWSEFAGAQVQRGAVHVFIRSYERPQKVTEVPLAALDGPLVPRVTAQCFTDFGS